jgi:hypothetical protein
MLFSLLIACIYFPLTFSCQKELTEAGNLKALRFPYFRHELLYQNHWSAADDTGRIKIIISEGFPRDSPAVPLDRVKNIVAFAFQHAPLGMPATDLLIVLAKAERFCT